MIRHRRPALLGGLALLSALLLAACGARAVVPGGIVPGGTATTSAAVTAANSATTSAVGASTASATTTGTGTAVSPAPTEGVRSAATAAPLATGAPRVASVPQQPSQQAPRTNRSGFVVALDPGHGGDESGAAANGVVERDSNLDLALRVEGYLNAAGVQVHLTRRDNGRATGLVTPNGDTRTSTRDDLQTRVSDANRAGADVFVSLHSNGSGDPYMRGFEAYYESRRPFADENYRLAREVLDGALRGATAAGYHSSNRGIIDAACWRNFNGRCVGLFVLSPGGTTTGPNGTTGQVKEATSMPAVLLESLFISSPDDAAMLKSDTVRASLAKGIADGILRYLGVPA